MTSKIWKWIGIVILIILTVIIVWGIYDMMVNNGNGNGNGNGNVTSSVNKTKAMGFISNIRDKLCNKICG